MPLLSAKNSKRRLQFAQAHQNWTIEYCKNVAWSDESRFLLRHSDGRVIIWRKEHESMVCVCVCVCGIWLGFDYESALFQPHHSSLSFYSPHVNQSRTCTAPVINCTCHPQSVSMAVRTPTTSRTLFHSVCLILAFTCLSLWEGHKTYCILYKVHLNRINTFMLIVWGH